MEEKDHFISRTQAEEMFAAYDKLSHEERQKLLAQLPEGFLFPLADVIELTKKGLADQFMVRLGLKEGAKSQKEITPVLYVTNEKGEMVAKEASADAHNFLDEGQRWP